ncbi:MAG: hypothetical protein KGZ40_01435 [Clostridiales bacterium]|nr:hypothetical protein [Clostridiales bacterium]
MDRRWLIGFAFLVALVAASLLGVFTDRFALEAVAVLVVVALLAGILPFTFGAIVQLALRERVLPSAALWLGSAAFVILTVLTGQPELTLFGSRVPGYMFLFVLYAWFLDHGARLARSIVRRRASRLAANGEVEA